MLFSDKLEKIWQDHKEVIDQNCKIALKNALCDEIANIGSEKGPNYDLVAHLKRIDNAWRFFTKNKNELNEEFFKIALTHSAPNLIKLVWPNDNKK